MCAVLLNVCYVAECVLCCRICAVLLNVCYVAESVPCSGLCAALLNVCCVAHCSRWTENPRDPCSSASAEYAPLRPTARLTNAAASGGAEQDPPNLPGPSHQLDNNCTQQPVPGTAASTCISTMCVCGSSSCICASLCMSQSEFLSMCQSLSLSVEWQGCLVLRLPVCWHTWLASHLWLLQFFVVLAAKFHAYTEALMQWGVCVSGAADCLTLESCSQPPPPHAEHCLFCLNTSLRALDHLVSVWLRMPHLRKRSLHTIAHTVVC